MYLKKATIIIINFYYYQIVELLMTKKYWKTWNEYQKLYKYYRYHTDLHYQNKIKQYNLSRYYDTKNVLKNEEK